ncbi:MAG: IS5 family transposase, partial [Planctomycetota bacterium]
PRGRWPIEPRMWLHPLEYQDGLSDEAVVARWVENPYFQHFTGETFFQHMPPIHPSSLSRWRDRIGEEGAEWLLTKTIEAGRAAGVVDDDRLSRVSVDTTVMEKNIAHPTDARLYEKARAKLVGLAKDLGIDLRQTYARKAPRLAQQIGRYAHARQFKRMRKALRTLRGYAGRVMRDIRRRLDAIPEGPTRDGVAEMLARVSKLLHQAPRSKGKIYALHEPAVDCISKGKARVRYEFGCKVSVATTIDGGFVVGMRAMPGNPYDGHTLAEALEQVETLTDMRPAVAVVDRGYRGHDVRGTRVLISGMRRDLTKGLKAQLRRRSAIEPEIGHMKTDGRLARCPLKGTQGDAIFAVPCGCGHNIRKILARLRALLALLGAWIADAVSLSTAPDSGWRHPEMAT